MNSEAPMPDTCDKKQIWNSSLRKGQCWSSIFQFFAVSSLIVLTPLVHWSPLSHWISLPVYDLLIGVTFLAYTCSILVPKISLPKVTWVDGLQILFLGWIVLNALTKGSWESARVYVDLLLLFFVLTHTKLSNRQVTTLGIVLLCAGVLVAALSLCTKLDVNRNALSGYLCSFLPMSLLLWCNPRRSLRLLGVILTTILAYGVTLTFTRAGYIACLVGMVAFALIKDRRLIVVPLVYMLLCGATIDGAKERFFKIGGISAVVQEDSEEGDSSMTARKHLWNFAWENFKSSPVLGIGVGNYKIQLAEYRAAHPLDQRFPQTVEPHNSFLKVLCEMGLPGLMLFFGFIGASLWPVLSGILHGNWKTANPFTLALLSGMFAFGAHNMTNTLFIVLPCAMVFWVALALVSHLVQNHDVS